MLAVTGRRSQIIQDLIPFLPEGETIKSFHEVDGPWEADKYVFAAGLLSNEKPNNEDLVLDVNFQAPMWAIDKILRMNDRARICVVGSESGISGSYDITYATAKAALHQYVCMQRLRTPEQQLVCVAPGIIGDAGMTLRRKDTANLAERQIAHPKRRFLLANEVSRLIHFLLYVDRGYITNTVIRMNGGEHTCK